MKNRDYHINPDVDELLSSLSASDATALREVWERTDIEEMADFPNAAAIERVWHNIESFAHTKAPTRRLAAEPRRPHRMRLVNRPFLMAIAAALLIGAVSLALWHRPVEWSAPPGERLAVNLPDGSHVELNSGATLRYSRPFGRTVRLVGEAFFDVSHNGKPFVVKTFNADIEVLGTRFNVRAWPSDESRTTTVALASGRVSLAPQDYPERAVILSPGETREVRDRALVVSPVENGIVEDATAWMHGDLIFKNRQLAIILADLERRFAIGIDLRPAELGMRKINLAFRNPSDAESVLRDLCVAMGLAYSRVSGGYEIHESPVH